MKKNAVKKNQLIYEEGDKLYPISEECDERCDKLHNVENWAEAFYHLKEGKSKERFIEITKKSEYSLFFEALNFEYGINNHPINLEKALRIYKEAANNTTDLMSMIRMYHIHKKDFHKFNLPKRNRVLEKFYIFKCFAFSPNEIINRNQSLFNRFDIYYEVMIHFEEEDEDHIIFHKFIKFLNKNYYLYDIDPNDLLLIESVIDYLLPQNPSEKVKALKNLTNLASGKNLEAMYKLACLTNPTTINEIKNKEERFKILVDKKYYRSYIDYALYLNSKKRYKESMELLKIARKRGVIPSAGYLYYDIFLNENNFSDIMSEAIKTSFSKECELYILFNILIDDILIDSVYSFFEFIYLRKIFIKHYNMQKEFNQYFFDYTKEISNFLIKITEGNNINLKKRQIKKYFCRDDYFQELYLACGTLYFYGIENIVEIDNKKALIKFIISYKSSDSESYQRFCYFYIYRIRKRLYDEFTSLNNNINNNANEGFINENIMKKTEKELYKKYQSAINDNDLSSSFFYYLSRMLNKKIGNDGNRLCELIYLSKANELRNDTLGTGSIINIYRKQKSKILYDKYKDECDEEIKKIKNNDSEGYGEVDGSFCPICFTNKRDFMALPCKHLFCESCIGQIKKCAICRASILMKHYIGQ